MDNTRLAFLLQQPIPVGLDSFAWITAMGPILRASARRAEFVISSRPKRGKRRSSPKGPWVRSWKRSTGLGSISAALVAAFWARLIGTSLAAAPAPVSVG